jgi:hypothetical protein
MTSSKQKSPNVVFVVSEDWYFVSHRLPQARAVRDLGFNVIVATRIGGHADTIRAEGFDAVSISFDRGGMNPMSELRVVLALSHLMRRERPSAVHAVSIKPILDVGFAAAMASGTVVINAFTGMGSLLGNRGRRSLLKRVVAAVIRWTMRWNRAHAVVQNMDDRAFLVRQGFAPESRTWVIRGSGVDARMFCPRPEPAEPVVATMVSRLLSDKGVGEFCAAAQLLRARGVAVRMCLAGDTDPANPSSFGSDQIERWRQAGDMEILGRRDDIAELWAHSHIAVLPSYREGLPKSLVEAAASGRPLVTTDTIGCRDLVPDGRTGILVPVADSQALADAIQYLAENSDLRHSMGAAARELVLREFTEDRVAHATQQLYHTLIGRDHPPRARAAQS